MHRPLLPILPAGQSSTAACLTLLLPQMLFPPFALLQGNPGPLTVEALWFERAAAVGDMLFVAAAGNNGTDAVPWATYPAAFPQVLAVAGVDCTGRPGYYRCA